MNKIEFRPFGKAIAGACLVVALSACCPGKSDQENAKASSPAGTAALAATAMVSAASPSPLLQTVPEVLRECDLKGVGVPVVVSWDATAANVHSVKVWVQGPGQERKLWAAGGAKDKQTTGPWTLPGTTFILTDANDKALNQLTVRSIPCSK